MATSDGLVRYYYAMRDNPGGAAVDLVTAHGRVYAKVCNGRRVVHGKKVRCKSRTRHYSDARRCYVCGHCGEPWRFWERRQLHGEIQETKRPGSTELGKGRWLDVSVHLSRLLEDPAWRWAARIYVASATGWTLRRIAREGPDLFPEAPISWTRYSVGELERQGREEWERRLEAAGIDFERVG